MNKYYTPTNFWETLPHVSTNTSLKIDAVNTKIHLVEIISSLPTSILVVGADENIIFANNAAERLFKKKFSFSRDCRCGDFISCINRNETSSGCGYSKNCPSCTLLKDIKSGLADQNHIFEAGEMKLVRDNMPNQMWIKFHAQKTEINNNTIIIISTDDITGQKQTEWEYQVLFNEMLEGLALHEIICNSDGQPVDYRFLTVNPAFEKMTGLKADQIINRTVLEVLPKTEPHWIETYGNVALSGTPAFFENYTASLKKHFQVTAFRTSPGQFACIVTDITRQKEMEKNQKRLQDQLNQAQKLETIGTLAGGIAHDFNNILFPIIGHAEILMEDFSDDNPYKESVKEILIGANRAKALVDQILAFSRQTRQETIQLRPDLIVKEVIKLIKSTLPSTIKIEKFIAANCCMIMADPTQIHQVAMNLITNAYHAMHNSGGILTIQLQNADHQTTDPELQNLPKGPFVRFSVKDTGTGMDEDTVKKIFDPYFTTKPKGKGTGLGLSVVHGIVKNMGGEIIVNSTLGKGSCFDIYLPAITNENNPLAAEMPAAKIQTGNERLLLIDDEQAILEIEEKMLERLGYEIVTQISSLKALKMVMDDPEKFDLVITDMTMPEMTGDILAEKITTIAPDLPILICTGFSENINLETAKAMGVKGLLFKPIIKSEFAKTIREVLDNKK